MEDPALELYHGTSSNFLESILSKGLLPRKYTNISNWEQEDWIGWRSHPDLVYLADTPEKARNLAERAVRIHGGKVIILSVLVYPNKLRPDEDAGAAIAQRGNWKDSLNARGTCAHFGPISPEHVGVYEEAQQALKLIYS